MSLTSEEVKRAAQWIDAAERLGAAEAKIISPASVITAPSMPVSPVVLGMTEAPAQRTLHTLPARCYHQPVSRRLGPLESTRGRPATGVAGQDLSWE